MRFAFIDAEKACYPIPILCRVMKVSRSGYYAWRNRHASTHEQEDEALRGEVLEIFETSNGTYGSPRVHADLAQRGTRVGRKRVSRLMKEQNLRAAPPRRWKRTTDSDHGKPVADNVLARDFTASVPNERWAGDITYLWAGEGWLYLAVVIDLFSRRVVGWAIESHMRAELAGSALRMAIGRRLPGSDLLYHSDQGSQYASDDFQELLKAHGITCSMSRRGNCWDNAVVESFFGTLKTELIYRQPWRSRAEVRTAVIEYIELFYNATRRHSSLGYRSPVDFERSNAPVPGDAP